MQDRSAIMIFCLLDRYLPSSVTRFFPKVAQKVANAVFCIRVRFFKKAQKVANHLGFFCQELPKITQSVTLLLSANVTDIGSCS